MSQNEGAVGRAFGDEVLPPDHAAALHEAVHELIDELCEDTQPSLPMKKCRAGTMTHDYKRNGTTTLFAALNYLEGKVSYPSEYLTEGRKWLHHL